MRKSESTPNEVLSSSSWYNSGGLLLLLLVQPPSESLLCYLISPIYSVQSSSSPISEQSLLEEKSSIHLARGALVSVKFEANTFLSLSGFLDTRIAKEMRSS